jgi:3D (Asp-Asp-Asp) domain-containing protein
VVAALAVVAVGVSIMSLLHGAAGDGGLATPPQALLALNGAAAPPAGETALAQQANTLAAPERFVVTDQVGAVPGRAAVKAGPAVGTFQGRAIVADHTRQMVVTAYCPCKLCCGPKACGITASGMSVYTNGMKLVAADAALMPFGTLVSLPGYARGRPVPVLDRGGAIKGNRLDILLPTHAQALAWGRRTVTVTVWRYAEP